MHPNMVQFITDGISVSDAKKRYLKRRKWIMDQCNGPIVLSAPMLGPNQRYPWAHCDAPVYQDSYILFLTGINQYPLHIVLDPISNEQHIFLPEFDANRAFWDGQSLSANHDASTSFLVSAGFSHIHSIKSFSHFIGQRITENPNWHLLIHEKGRKRVKDDAYKLFNSISRRSTKSPKITNISALSWDQRLSHDQFSITAFKSGIAKTATAYKHTISMLDSFKHEFEIAGHLKGELLKQTPFGLSFPPIIAKNQNAAILHYIDCCDSLQKNDLILFDFGLRWQSMCTDISRTISLSGTYTPFQKRLVEIVSAVQCHVITLVKPGVTFDELNDACWEEMERLLDRDFIAKGGTMKRDYNKQPHNVGHLLGIQTHDGDPYRNYRSHSLPHDAIITIEPGLYGQFELNGETIHCGIRIEDNILITKHGNENLSESIPK